MSKFSSFKESQLLFENWRGYSGASDAPIQEQEFVMNMTPDEKAQEMLKILTSMNEEDPEAFNKAFQALGAVSSGEGSV